jgi:hypothetical protein
MELQPVKTWILLLLTPLVCFAQNTVTVGNGVTVGSGVTFGGVVSTVTPPPPPPPPPTGLTFSPAAGTYTGAQTITVTQSFGSGHSIFCTTDGTPASPASILYSGPIAVSANTTINCLVESTGSVIQNFQAGAALGFMGRKLCAPIYKGDPKVPCTPDPTKTPPVTCAYQNGTPYANCGGGVGSDQPSTWSLTTDGTTMLYSITGKGGAPQILSPGGGNGCDSCTHQTQHFRVEPVQNTHMQNIEVDMWQNDATRNIEHAGSLQCNQQPGKDQWQIDNQQGSWQNTGITDHCPLPTGVYTDVVLADHWTIGDTGCGGLGCTTFDYIMVNGVKHTIGTSLENDNPGWGSGCANQKQLDLNPGSTSSNPFTASENIQQDNNTCSFGTTTTGSAAYTIH